MQTYDVIVLFSGGLDSLLSAKVLEKQGLSVKCLHFVTPFFGSAQKAKEWAKEYSLDVEVIDVSEEYSRMLYNPTHGYGKILNPCIDCKILMLSIAQKYMKKYGACCVATGEVVGQRPMSQRKEALQTILLGSGLDGNLLRPLTAKNLPPTKAELDGIIDREQLYDFSGRSRNGQLSLACQFGITNIPSPAGGCALTVAETAQCYYPILRNVENPSLSDFTLARSGRQMWNGKHWLIVGRNAQDTALLEQHRHKEDYTLRFVKHAGPMAIARVYNGIEWEEELLEGAMFRTVSFAPKVRVLVGSTVEILVAHNGEEHTHMLTITEEHIAKAVTLWQQLLWDGMKKKAHQKAHLIR